MYKITFGYVM